MKNTRMKLSVYSIVVTVGCMLLPTFAFTQQMPQLDVVDQEGRTAHIMAAMPGGNAIMAENNARSGTTSHSGTGVLIQEQGVGFSGTLTYHGGPVILKATTYAIFWVPPTLQNGTPTSMTSHYQTIQTNFLKDYPGHSIANNNTQYFQGPPSFTLAYIQNAGSFGGSFVDTSAYPASGCSDSATPGGCLSDAQLRAEISKVMTLKGWTGGTSKVFFLFTSSGEGSCFSAGNCSYTQYCGYHSFFTNGSAQTVIYGNEPFGDITHCQVNGAPSPNSDPAADAAANTLSHELTEAITDPLLNAWRGVDVSHEIGDLCNFYYGYPSWKAGTATEFWNNHFYLVQTEYSNNLFNANETINGVNGPAGCFNAGPEL